MAGISEDIAPQSGDSPWGYGESLSLFWTNETLKETPMPAEPFPQPGGNAPAPTLWAMFLAIALTLLALARRARPHENPRK